MARVRSSLVNCLRINFPVPGADSFKPTQSWSLSLIPEYVATLAVSRPARDAYVVLCRILILPL